MCFCEVMLATLVLPRQPLRLLLENALQVQVDVLMCA